MKTKLKTILFICLILGFGIICLKTNVLGATMDLLSKPSAPPVKPRIVVRGDQMIATATEWSEVVYLEYDEGIYGLVADFKKNQCAVIVRDAAKPWVQESCQLNEYVFKSKGYKPKSVQFKLEIEYADPVTVKYVVYR